jgi:hypothetical protein
MTSQEEKNAMKAQLAGAFRSVARQLNLPARKEGFGGAADMKKMEKSKTPSERDKAFIDQYDYLLKWAFAQPMPEDKYGNEKRPYLSYAFVFAT